MPAFAQYAASVSIDLAADWRPKYSGGLQAVHVADCDPTVRAVGHARECEDLVHGLALLELLMHAFCNGLEKPDRPLVPARPRLPASLSNDEILLEVDHEDAAAKRTVADRVQTEDLVLWLQRVAR